MDRLMRAMLISTLLAGGSLAAHAQPGSPAVGTAMRLTMRGQPSQVHGTIASTSPTAWTIAHPNGSDSAYILNDVALAETRVSHRHTLRGALIGGGIGLVAGIALVLATEDDPCEGTTGFCVDIAPEAANTVALVGAPLIGAGAGALIGSLFKSTRWVPTVVPRTTVGATRIGMSWRFQ
jgi:hypothetical protein